MKFTLKRAVTAGILALGLTAGSIAAAAPASAATKYETFKETITVGHHTDKLIYTPASKKEFKGLGAGSERATYYNVTLKHGKKVLFSKKHVNTWKVFYIDLKVYAFGDKAYKSDKAIVAKLRAASKVSTAHAKKYVKKYVSGDGGGAAVSTLKEQTQACVNSQVTTVQVDIVETDTFQTGRIDCDNGIYIITSGSGFNFTVVGYDEKDNYKYTYDSTDGTFKEGHIN